MTLVSPPPSSTPTHSPTPRSRPAAAAGGALAHRFSRHPERYLQIFRVLRTYQLHQVVRALGLSGHHHDDDDVLPSLSLDAEHDPRPQHLADALEELGPCFIKLGQLLSTRPDLLPQPYIDALGRLQATVKPVPADQIQHVIESELGAPLDSLFASFDCQPLAAASMAQVHRATLHDGTDVVVKVQRPGVRQVIEVDLEVLGEMARFATRHTALGARYGIPSLVRELEYSLRQELDFRTEADNTRLIGRQVASFTHLGTPVVHPELSSRRVLTLSCINGRPLAQVSADERRSLDTPAIARDLLAAYLKQIVIDGVFHCDPHPGNILLGDDGRLMLLDFGMVGRLDAGQKDQIILLLLAFSERLGVRVADTYLEMIEIPPDLDRRAFTQDIAALVSRYHDMSGGRMALGSALLDLTRIAYRHRAPVPTAMTLLGKTMLNLDGTIRVLSPELDPVQLIRDYMIEVMQSRLMVGLSPGRVFAWVLDLKHLAENSPRRADMILDKLANDQLTLRLQVDRLDAAMAKVDAAASRVALGVVAGALLVGGSSVVSALIRTGRLGRGQSG